MSYRDRWKLVNGQEREVLQVAPAALSSVQKGLSEGHQVNQGICHPVFQNRSSISAGGRWKA